MFEKLKFSMIFIFLPSLNMLPTFEGSQLLKITVMLI